ncbi:hypothetical protein U3516DRAFT_672255 [Neocallimastix sp. 'constans']
MSDIYESPPGFNRPAVPDFFNSDRPVSMGSSISSAMPASMNDFVNQHPNPYNQGIHRPSMSSVGSVDNYDTYNPPLPQPAQSHPQTLYHPNSVSSFNSEYNNFTAPPPPQYPPQPLSQNPRRSSLSSVVYQ